MSTLNKLALPNEREINSGWRDASLRECIAVESNITLIKSAVIYNGLDVPPVLGDILIEGGKIAAIGKNLDIPEGSKIINAKGLYAAPGFIDLHRHCDLAFLRDPDFGELELSQGITTAFSGNCGLAPVPRSPCFSSELFKFIEPCLGLPPESFLPDSFPKYLEEAERASSRINLGFFTAAGAVKTAVRGFGKGALNGAELDRAVGLISEAVSGGAYGLSMGLMYVPECYSSRDELIAFAKASGRHGGILTAHIRGEGDYLIDSVLEITEIARDAEIPLQISHFKSTGLSNWNDKIFRAIEIIESARTTGQDITVDFYPYTGGSTTLWSLVPPAFTEDSHKESLKSLYRPDGRDKLKKMLRTEYSGWDNMIKGIGWERIILSSAVTEYNQKYTGKSLAEISDAEHIDPDELLCRMLVSESGNAAIILMSMSQDDVITVANLPYSMLISDSLYGGSGLPHPRLYGSFTKFIREYVRERKLMTMEKAIHKMTFMPANRVGLSGRGVLEPGAIADIIIFNPYSLTDLSSYEDPKRLSVGVCHVLAGGVSVWENGRLTGAREGKILAHKYN